MKHQDNITCASSNHANLDVFIVQHSPRFVDAVLKDGTKYKKRVVTTDTWRFWHPASSRVQNSLSALHLQDEN